MSRQAPYSPARFASGSNGRAKATCPMRSRLTASYEVPEAALGPKVRRQFIAFGGPVKDRPRHRRPPAGVIAAAQELKSEWLRMNVRTGDFRQRQASYSAWGWEVSLTGSSSISCFNGTTWSQAPGIPPTASITLS